MACMHLCTWVAHAVSVLGPNAARILRRLGVLDEVISQCKEPSLNMGEFRYLSAEGEHEVLYEVEQ